MSMDEWIGEKIPDDILDEAAMWIARLDSEEADRYDRKEFALWLEQDPLHGQAYGELTPVWARMNTLGELKDAIGTGNVVSILPAARKTLADDENASPIPQWGIVTAIVLIFVGFLAGTLGKTEVTTFETAVGQQQQIALEDGSTVYLDTDSRIHVRYSENGRHVTLEKGEAVFVVAEDKERPFEVETSFGEVRALGTEFLVSDLTGHKQVSVLKGTVQLIDARPDPALTEFEHHNIYAGQPRRRTLEKGESIRILSPGTTDSLEAAVEPDWLDGVLSWKDVPLSEALSEFARYTTIRYQLAPDLSPDLLVSGDVNTYDSKSFLNFLSSYNIAATSRRENWYLLSSKK
ncbi:FecR family protein [Emcibacter sp.]|uniref:FecR family protein n=1 Tax=Emcibacter sp. TaxID=1979954 RepID=UPI003A91D9E6